jgi:hypothetical protein
MFEIVVRGEEHESAGHSHGDSDNAPIELDGKTLRKHNPSPDERHMRGGRTGRRSFANRSSALVLRKRAPL